MARKRKRKRTAAERQVRAELKARTHMVLINGKQERIRRASPLVEGRPVDEWIASADPLWLHANEMWWVLPHDDSDDADVSPHDEQDLPF